MKAFKKKNKKVEEQSLTEQAGNINLEKKQKLSIKSLFGLQKEEKQEEKQRGLQIRFLDCEEFVPLGAWQYHKVYSDSLGQHLVIVADEVAELLQAEGGRSAEAKEIAAMQAELETCIKSITQLGRSSCISMVLATQRNDASVIPGIIQNNPLKTDTKVRVLRPVNKERDLAKLEVERRENTKNMMKSFANKFDIDYDDNGLVFENDEDKKRFFENMKEDARIFDIENNIESLVFKM